MPTHARRARKALAAVLPPSEGWVWSESIGEHYHPRSSVGVRLTRQAWFDGWTCEVSLLRRPIVTYHTPQLTPADPADVVRAALGEFRQALGLALEACP